MAIVLLQQCNGLLREGASLSARNPIVMILEIRIIIVAVTEPNRIICIENMSHNCIFPLFVIQTAVYVYPDPLQ